MIKSYATMTPEEYYQATGDYTEPNNKIIYSNNEEELIITITENKA